MVKVPHGSAEMKQATARARETIDEFIEALEAGSPDSYGFTVSVPVRDGDLVEHMWLTDVVSSCGRLSGRIDNKPQKVSTAKLGQRLSVAKNEINDWMYFRGPRAIGNRTLRVLLADMPEDQAEALKLQLGWD
ncbi:MAG: DUF2314 domain-containing protein [Planctomycetota bacterium]